MPLTLSTGHPNYLDVKTFQPTVSIGPNFDLINDKYQNITDNCNYRVPQEGCLLVNENDSTFNIIHLNCRSINSDEKFDEFLLFLERTKVDWSVICLSETWLTDDLEKKRTIEGYKSYFDSRIQMHGGGVAIFIKNDIESQPLNTHQSFDHTESIFVECKINDSKKLVIGVIYRPPKLPPSTFLPQLEQCLEDITVGHNSSVIVTGDFNFDLFKASDDGNVNTFLNTFLMHGFLPTICKTTRMSNVSCSLIDNIFCNNIEIIDRTGIIFDDCSDHFPVFARYNLSVRKQINNPSKEKVFNFKRLDKLRDHLRKTLVNFYSIKDPEEACNCLKGLC